MMFGNYHLFFLWKTLSINMWCLEATYADKLYHLTNIPFSWHGWKFSYWSWIRIVYYSQNVEEFIFSLSPFMYAMTFYIEWVIDWVTLSKFVKWSLNFMLINILYIFILCYIFKICIYYIYIYIYIIIIYIFYTIYDIPYIFYTLFCTFKLCYVFCII